MTTEVACLQLFSKSLKKKENIERSVHVLGESAMRADAGKV